MGKPTNLFILLLSLLIATATSSPATSFIKSSCRSATYPGLCVQFLFLYSDRIQESPVQLAQTALEVSLTRARLAKSFVSKLYRFRGLKKREYRAIKDCIEETDDAVYRLTDSVQQINRSGRATGDDLRFMISNAQTWTTAALTDADTCLDGFSGRVMDGKVKSSVRTQMVSLTQVTSNALALVNSYASKMHNSLA